MASASDATSCYFVANLGNLDSAVVERLESFVEGAKSGKGNPSISALITCDKVLSIAKYYKGSSLSLQ